NFNFIVEWTSEIEVQPTLGESTTASKLTLAEVPQVNHRICQNFEGVMQLTYALKPKQKAAELILPTEHPLNRITLIGMLDMMGRHWLHCDVCGEKEIGPRSGSACWLWRPL